MCGFGMPCVVPLLCAHTLRPMPGFAFVAVDGARAAMDGTSDDYDTELSDGLRAPSHGWRLTAPVQQHLSEGTSRAHEYRPQKATASQFGGQSRPHKFLRVEVPIDGPRQPLPHHVGHVGSSLDEWM